MYKVRIATGVADAEPLEMQTENRDLTVKTCRLCDENKVAVEMVQLAKEKPVKYQKKN